MYFDAVVVEIKTFLLLFRLALAILTVLRKFLMFTILLKNLIDYSVLPFTISNKLFDYMVKKKDFQKIINMSHFHFQF